VRPAASSIAASGLAAVRIGPQPAGPDARRRVRRNAAHPLTHHPLFFLNGCNTAAFSPDALSPFIRKLVRDSATYASGEGRLVGDPIV